MQNKYINYCMNQLKNFILGGRLATVTAGAVRTVQCMRQNSVETAPAADLNRLLISALIHTDIY
jgi:hypothetical protein